MADQQIPFFHYSIWKNANDKVIGRELSIFEWIASKKRDCMQWDFKGKTAHCFVTTDDNDIDRKEALDFCIKAMAGDFITVEVDLKELSYHVR